MTDAGAVDYKARILEWLREHHEGASFEVTGVESVEPHGSDWDGDTEGGFYTSFTVLIAYATTDASRPRMTKDVQGEDMESLWRWVVGQKQGSGHLHTFKAVEGTIAYARPDAPCAVQGCTLTRSEHPEGLRGGGR